VATVLLLVPLLPGHASAARGGEVRFPSGWREGGQSPPAPARVRLARAIASRPTQEELRAIQRETLTTPDPLRPGQIFATRAPGVARGSGASGDGVLYAVSTATGDLDGDGRSDLLTQTLGFADDFVTTLRARGGDDGTELWSKTFGDADVGVADLTGDGTLEVLTLEYLGGDGQYRSTPAGVLAAGAGTYRITVLSGRDASKLWSVDLQQSQAFAFADENNIVRRGAVTGGSGLLFSVVLTPDADGDGSSDVFLGTLDYGAGFAEALTPTSTIAASADALRFHGRILSGPSGRDVASFSAPAYAPSACDPSAGCERVAGLPWIEPVDDLSGDGLADVVALSYPMSSGRLEAFEGTGKAPLWSAPLPNGAAFPYGMELTGDGRADVLLIRQISDEFFVSYRAEAYEGTGRGELWRRSFSYGLVPFGDADGDGGIDLIDFVGSYSTLWQTAFSGASGADLWTRLDEVPGGDGFGRLGYCVCPDDLDGDDAGEVFVSWGRFEFTPDGLRILTLRALAVAGADGTTLWMTPELPDFGEIPSSAGGDVDGNGVRDLWTEAEPDDAPHAVELRDGLSLGMLWTAPLPAAADAFVGEVRAADITKDDGLETALWRLGVDDAGQHLTSAVAVPGAVRWTGVEFG
jgi:hypothetical protein